MTTKIKYIYFILFLLIPVLLSAQEVQEKYVMDFNGGLVNSISNSLMKDNQALVLENYDIDPFGNVSRRKGMALHYIDSDRTTSALFPYYNVSGNQMLTIQANTSYFDDDTANVAVGILNLCEDTNSTCTTSVYPGFYISRRNNTFPYNMTSTVKDGNLLIAASKSEMLVYDGNYAFPARPYGPGQPHVAVMEGDGNINARVKYKYCYKDSSDASADSTSNFSSPSWEYKIDYGKAYVYNIKAPIDTGNMFIMIYRSDDDGQYALLDSISITSDTLYSYLDDAATPTGAAAPNDYGVDFECDCDRDPTDGPNWCDDSIHVTDLIPPGAFTVVATPGGVNGIFNDLVTDSAGTPLDSIAYPIISYVIVYQDSAGRTSYSSPPVCVKVDDTVGRNTTDLQCQLNNIPIPVDSSIVNKILLRRIYGGETFPVAWCESSPEIGAWYIVDTLKLDTTAYQDYDVHRIGATHIASRLWCRWFNNYSYEGTGCGGYTPDDSNDVNMAPEMLCYDHDSAITFQPFDITMHKSRCFAIGHPINRNWLYYSEFGRPTTFPYDKIISTPSKSGDWFQRLISIGNQLVLFRQNSIWQLSGLSFYQFSFDEIITGIGLSAPRSLLYEKGKLYFAHTSGLYRWGEYEIPLSYPISKSLDSTGEYLRVSVSNMINGELWFSVPINDSVNNKTYIYSERPTPHWKSYNFGIRDAANYNYDTLALDYATDKYILLNSNDTLYRWNYSDNDTLDGNDTIIATVQSKYFFEGEDREKILYVDLIGSGVCDSMTLTFFGNYSTDFATYDTLGTKSIDVDFSSEERQRVKVNHICKNFSVRIQDNGMGDYKLKGYVIGYISWDKRKVRP